MSLDIEIATTSYGVLCGAGENCWDHTLHKKSAEIHSTEGKTQNKKGKSNKNKGYSGTA